MSHEFATTWPEYDLPPRAREMLRYASRLTEAPSMVTSEDTDRLAAAGWTAREVWEITALASFFNFTGRLEAASGLPPDVIPESAALAEGRAG